MLRKATHDGFSVDISQTMSRLDRKQKCLRTCTTMIHQSCNVLVSDKFANRISNNSDFDIFDIIGILNRILIDGRIDP